MVSSSTFALIIIAGVVLFISLSSFKSVSPSTPYGTFISKIKQSYPL